MSFKGVVSKYFFSEKIQQVSKSLTKEGSEVGGIIGSSVAFFLIAIKELTNKNILFISETKDKAIHTQLEINSLSEDKKSIFFPKTYKKPYETETTDNLNILKRSEILEDLSESKALPIICSFSDAIFEKVPHKKGLEQLRLRLKKGETSQMGGLLDRLYELEFQKVDFVTEPGEFSVRGGIIDIYSFGNELPYRIQFISDKIGSVRTFDIESQLSEEQLEEALILPNTQNIETVSTFVSISDYLSDKTIVVYENFERTKERLDELFVEAKTEFDKKSTSHLNPEVLFSDATNWEQSCRIFEKIYFKTNKNLSQKFNLNISPQPSFNKNFDLLSENILEHQEDNYSVYIFCSNENQIDRFKEIFEDLNMDGVQLILNSNIHEGFIDHNHKIVCFTDHQIFGRFHKYKSESILKKKENIDLNLLNELKIGDYVTHIDHGIGRFAGLQKIENNGKQQEAVKIVYESGGILYCNIQALYKISKYSSKDAKEPKLNTLGTGTWKRLKSKTQKRVKEMAFDLINLYAKRKIQKGVQFSPDTYLQKELEASFIYEDTPDQLQTTADIKKDMESDTSMDRLVCGDVGFGKTEVALRAAFKAVTDGYQVIVLVPTTLLASQHYYTFKKRFKEFPVTVDYLNRFRTAKQKREILEKLKTGKIDVLIGTHQVVNKTIEYKNLGLLIVDEEHKFGVNVKDKIKTLKANIDTLTLTATPIPRTLQFSLMAARDLSIMKTPPPNRQSVETKIIPFSEEIIRDAIRHELDRNGQIYFLHNRVDNIFEMAGKLQNIAPDCRIGVGHGQMKGKDLEDLMMKFISGDLDILVSTTIIESGIDVPNANTMFIHQAQNFGLADLHQLRGRVGRSNKKAFCYLIAPPMSTIATESRKRLEAIEKYSDLGSGFNIAMKDLEIRGAGNLLGAEQSGFINDIGFHTYQKILQDCIEELKENEFKDLYLEENQQEEKSWVKEVVLESDLELLIPDSYVNVVEVRLRLYEKISKIESPNELDKIENELLDRFGEPPEEAKQLLKAVVLKWKARKLGIEKLIHKNGILLAYFVQKPKFFEGEIFSNILKNIGRTGYKIEIKEKKSKTPDELPKVYLRIEKIESVSEMLLVFEKLMEE